MHVTALSIARRYLGTREIPGEAHAAFIQAWHEQARLGRDVPDEIAWCGSFAGHVCWLLALPVPTPTAELPNRHIFRARYWLTVGRPVPLAEARAGFDVVIFARGGGRQPAPEELDAPGHVAFFLRLDGDRVEVVGGNQGDAVTEARYPRSHVLGVRRLYDEEEAA